MSCTIYGKEKVKFTYNVTDDHNAISPNSYSWVIEDTYPDGRDNTLISDNNSYNNITKVFESKGVKHVVAKVEFDDGWGNKYIHQDTIDVETHEYDPPILDFNWIPENPTLNKDIVFTQNHVDTRTLTTHYGNILSVDVDYYNDGAIDVTGLNKDDSFTTRFTVKQDTVPIKLIAYYNTGWDTKSVYKIKTLTMSNIPPEIDMNNAVNPKCIPEYIWSATGTDPDGNDDGITYRWKLYRAVEEEYVLIDEGTGITYQYVFQYEGEYKIELIGTDVDGGETVKSRLFSITFNDCGDSNTTPTTTTSSTGNIVIERRYFDWE